MATISASSLPSKSTLHRLPRDSGAAGGPAVMDWGFYGWLWSGEKDPGSSPDLDASHDRTHCRKNKSKKTMVDFSNGGKRKISRWNNPITTSKQHQIAKQKLNTKDSRFKIMLHVPQSGAFWMKETSRKFVEYWVRHLHHYRNYPTTFGIVETENQDPRHSSSIWSFFQKSFGLGQVRRS